MIYPDMMEHFKTWVQKTFFPPDEHFGPNPRQAALDFVPPQPIHTSSACRGCGAIGVPVHRIPLFEGQVLPPTWPGTWTLAAACAACAARQQALRYPVTLMVFRHMGKATP